MAENACFHTCGQCGKQFFTGTLRRWTYKLPGPRGDSKIWFCSWSCMSRWQKDHERVRNLDKELKEND